MRCDGMCNKELKSTDPVVEVERSQVFCTDCALLTTVERLIEVHQEPLFDTVPV